MTEPGATGLWFWDMFSQKSTKNAIGKSSTNTSGEKNIEKHAKGLPNMEPKSMPEQPKGSQGDKSEPKETKRKPNGSQK